MYFSSSILHIFLDDICIFLVECCVIQCLEKCYVSFSLLFLTLFCNHLNQGYQCHVWLQNYLLKLKDKCILAKIFLYFFPTCPVSSIFISSSSCRGFFLLTYFKMLIFTRITLYMKQFMLDTTQSPQHLNSS